MVLPGTEEGGDNDVLTPRFEEESAHEESVHPDRDRCWSHVVALGCPGRRPPCPGLRIRERQAVLTSWTDHSLLGFDRRERLVLVLQQRRPAGLDVPHASLTLRQETLRPEPSSKGPGEWLWGAIPSLGAGDGEASSGEPCQG